MTKGISDEEFEKCRVKAREIDRRDQLDIKLHEYKLAALTGAMTKVGGGFNNKDADDIAVVCDMVARAMAALDLDESGDGP